MNDRTIPESNFEENLSMTLRLLLSITLLSTAASLARADDVVGKPISPWQPGTLDIHQISTGRGNAGLYILPDGTTLLVDAGELATKTPKHTPDRPDGTRTAGERIVRYIRHALSHDPQPALDYVILTHFHQDHMGEVGAGMPNSRQGHYLLTGITRVAEDLKIGKLLDRCWPDYDNNVAQPERPFMQNYLAFVKWQTENNGLKVERFVPGRSDQVVLCRDAKKYPDFELRNVGANGEIWTGQGTATDHRMPSLETIPRKKWPDENVFSISFRLRYGKFKFFNGGDIPGIRPKSPEWYDIETPVAKVVGPVDAAILDHHGYVDTMNEFFVSTLRARVWTISVWDSHHPTPGVWERLHSEQLYPGPRDVFATDVHPDARLAIPGIDKLASGAGHIVLRVAPGGDSFRVVIVDDTSESHRVTKTFGPYSSR
jgi:beta-lactamase superfamily II metal-dependent hydrolase